MSSISYTRYYFPSISWPANTKATETQYIALLHTDGSYATLTICKEKWQNIREASVPNRDTGKPNSPLWPCGILCIFSEFCKFSSKEIRYFATFRSGHKICTMSFYHVHRKSRMIGRGGICPCCQCRRQCKIFASSVNFTIFTHFFCVFFLLKLLKLGKIDSIKFLT